MSRGGKYGIGLGIVIALLFVANLLVGSVPIPVSDVFHILLGDEGGKASWRFIVWEARLPQAMTALLCGSALAVCGLMLQTASRIRWQVRLFWALIPEPAWEWRL